MTHSLTDIPIYSYHTGSENCTLIDTLQNYHHNIQGLHPKTGELFNFLYLNPPCFTFEYHKNQLDLEAIQIDGYTLGASYCRC
jgi:hypothetical protein